jgi:hypothetical protein
MNKKSKAVEFFNLMVLNYFAQMTSLNPTQKKINLFLLKTLKFWTLIIGFGFAFGTIWLKNLDGIKSIEEFFLPQRGLDLFFWIMLAWVPHHLFTSTKEEVFEEPVMWISFGAVLYFTLILYVDYFILRTLQTPQQLYIYGSGFKNIITPLLLLFTSTRIRNYIDKKVLEEKQETDKPV